MSLKYEDFCARPAETTASIHRFAGLNETPPTVRTSAQEFHILGNNSMRLNTGRGISVDEKWRTALSEVDLNDFDKVASEFNARHGYT